MMIEVLGEDFGDSALARKDTDVHGEWARTTLLAQYIESGSGRGRVRRVLHAVLADGSEKCMREYGEVFKNETREKKSQKEVEALEQRKKLNLDENESVISANFTTFSKNWAGEAGAIRLAVTAFGQFDHW